MKRAMQIFILHGTFPNLRTTRYTSEHKNSLPPSEKGSVKVYEDVNYNTRTHHKRYPVFLKGGEQNCKAMTI
jgi:hypothetical protein